MEVNQVSEEKIDIGGDEVTMIFGHGSPPHMIFEQINNNTAQNGGRSPKSEVNFDHEHRFKHSVCKIYNFGRKIYYRVPGSKIILFFEMKLKRVAEINTTRETFRCRFHIYFTWLASESECKEWDERNKDKRYLPKWRPRFAWSNAITLHPTDADEPQFQLRDGWRYKSILSKSWKLADKESKLGFDPGLGRWHRVKYEYDIEFAEELELPGFPFDCQDLTMYLKVDGDTVDNCDIVPFPREFCLLDPQFSVLSEWDFESMVCEFLQTDSVKSKSERKYALVSIRIKASRRWEAHIGHMLVTSCMFTLGLGTFAQGLEGDELGNRLGYCVTLLLADVATLQLLFDNLPNIPYWTLFDLYMYSCFAFLTFVTGWTTLCGGVNVLHENEWIDTMVFVGATLIWLVAHIFFIGRAVYVRRDEREKLEMTSVQLHEHFKNSKTDRERRAIAVVWHENNLELTDKDRYGMYIKGKRKGDKETS